MSGFVKNPADHASSLIPKPGDWVEEASCAGSPVPDLWFANDLSTEDAADVALARRICAGCPVKAQCLAYALTVPAVDDSGIWGGTTEGQRRWLRRKQRRAA